MRTLCLFVLIIIASSCGNQNSKPISGKKSLPQIPQEKSKNETELTEDQRIGLTTGKEVDVIFLNSFKINSPISGTIESIADQGTVFKKGDLLVQLDNRAAFSELVSQKERFIVAVKTFSESNTQSSEWADFLAELDIYKLLPRLPKIANPQSGETQLISQYESVSKLEREMRNHFIVAQNDGTVLTQNYTIGKKVKNGTTILLTGKSTRKGFRLPENYAQNGNSILQNAKTGREYPVKIIRDKTIIKVEGDVPIGKYILKNT